VVGVDGTRVDQDFVRSVTRRLRTWATQPRVLVGLLVFFTIVIIAVVRNTWILSNGRIEDGDFAVNSILIDKALHFRLFVGNYSRVGFNHPGPALLYIQAAGQFLFFDVLHIAPRPYNAHVLSIVTFCAAMAAASSSILIRRTRSLLSGVTVLGAVLVLGVAQKGAIVSTSFPEIYIWPYLLLTVAGASVMTGEPSDLPWAILAIGFLCHGHVSFILFGAGFLSVMGTVLWRRRGVEPVSRRVVVKCVLVAFVFVLPFALNLILHWPGELLKYWRYTQSSKTSGHPWPAIFRFIASYWSVDGTIGYALIIGLLVATALLVLRWDRPATRSIGFGLVVATVLSTFLLAIYAYRGIDDLSYRYVAEFYLNAPVGLLLAVGCVATGAATAKRAAKWIGAVGLIGLITILSVTPQMKALYPGANWVAGAEQFLDQTVPPDTTRIMRFPLDVWPGVAGIVEQSRRNGNSVCIDEPAYGFLFNKSMVCSAQQRAEGVVVQALLPSAPPSTDAADQIRYDGAQIVLEVQGRP